MHNKLISSFENYSQRLLLDGAIENHWVTANKSESSGPKFCLLFPSFLVFVNHFKFTVVLAIFSSSKKPLHKTC